MYRVYYDEQGIIMMMINQTASSDLNPYEYIDIEEKINISLYTVDLETKELVAKPE